MVAETVGVHLVHADGHVRPVVGLVQLDVLLAFDVSPLGILVGRIVGGALQLDGHGQVVVHIGLAVDQPLLGDGHAELAGGVDVDQAGGGGAVLLDLVLVAHAGQFLEPGHGAHVGVGLGALAHGIAGRGDLGHGVGAHGQVFHGHGRAGIDLEDLGIAVVVAEAVLGHIVGRVADGHGDLGVEGSVAEIRGLVGAVDEHTLVNGQLAKIGCVGDGDLVVVVGGVFLGTIVVERQCAVGGRISGDIRLGHGVGDLSALLVHGQVGPLDRQGLGVLGDGLGGVSNVQHMRHAVRLVGAGQGQRDILAQELIALVVPGLGGADDLGLGFVRVDHFEHEVAVVVGQRLSVIHAVAGIADILAMLDRAAVRKLPHGVLVLLDLGILAVGPVVLRQAGPGLAVGVELGQILRFADRIQRG